MIRALWPATILPGLLSIAMWAGVSSQLQRVIVEPQRKLQPAGPGKQPFDVTRHTIPLREIVSSVPRDVIPALSDPTFLSADQARGLLKDSDRVLGVSWNGEAKAYPVGILNWHELVNDTVAGRPVLVSW
jgi:hypothetical protein